MMPSPRTSSTGTCRQHKNKRHLTTAA